MTHRREPEQNGRGQVPLGPRGTWRERVPRELWPARDAEAYQGAMLRAACAKRTDLVDDEARYDELKLLCASCPVSACCAAVKMDLRPHYGIWAGRAGSHKVWRDLAKGIKVAVVDGLRLVDIVPANKEK